MSFDFDLFVIGGGSGGVRAARVAASEHGARVGLAEESRYGGTCVIRGCVPKKLMVYASEFTDMPGAAQSFGWDIAPGAFSWTRFHENLSAELDRLEGIYRRLLANAGVESFDQRARLVDGHTVELADGTRKTARVILLAMGGWPAKPDMPGADLALTSNEIFHLEHLPETILINGGGYIASEFAGILTGLGVKVTQAYRGPEILRGFDDGARAAVSEGMRARGVEILYDTTVEALSAEADGRISARFESGESRSFERVMFATGRAPKTADMGLEEAGVRLGRSGEVVVDDYSQTSVPSVYALGDVTGRPELTPVAIRDAMAFVETVFAGRPRAVDHELIPTAVFTQPELGTVGLTEAEAVAAGPVEIYETSFTPMQKSFAGRVEKAFMKIIVAAESQRVLGVHIVAPGAGEMIQCLGIAVKMGATKADFDRTVAVHPTMAEELVTMRSPSRTAGEERA